MLASWAAAVLLNSPSAALLLPVSSGGKCAYTLLMAHFVSSLMLLHSGWYLPESRSEQKRSSSSPGGKSSQAFAAVVSHKLPVMNMSGGCVNDSWICIRSCFVRGLAPTSVVSVQSQLVTEAHYSEGCSLGSKAFAAR